MGTFEERFSNGGVKYSFCTKSGQIQFEGQSSTLVVDVIPVDHNQPIDAVDIESYQLYVAWEVNRHGRRRSIEFWDEYYRENPYQDHVKQQRQRGELAGTYHCHYRLDGELVCV